MKTTPRILLLACVLAAQTGILAGALALAARSHGGGSTGLDDPGCKSCLSQAATLFSAGKNQDAADLLRSYSARCPHNEKLHLMLSTILVRTQAHSQEAADEAGRAVAAAPNSVAAHLQWGLALNSMGENMHATEEFERVVDLDPSNYEAWSSLASLYGQLHDDQKARQAAARAADLEPSTSAVRLQTLTNLEHQGRTAEARAELKRLIASPDSGPGFLQQLAGEGLNIAAYDEAAQAAAKVTQASPKSQAAWKALATAQLLGNNYQGCLDSSKKMLGLDAKATEPHALSGAALVGLGKTKEGEKELQRAINAEPDMGIALFGLGRLKFTQGDYQAASDNLSRCLEADPALSKCPEVSFLLAQALEKVGEPEQSLAYYRQSLSYGLTGSDASQAQESVQRLTVKIK